MTDNNSKVFVNDNGDKMSLIDIKNYLMKHIVKHEEVSFACYIQYGGSIEFKKLCSVDFSGADCFKIDLHLGSGERKLFDSPSDAVKFLNRYELAIMKNKASVYALIVQELELACANHGQ